jgi:integrase
MMADAIGAAGFPDRCVLHGLRKAAARRLAEAGCTEKEIAAVTGHTTLKEIARYTRAADQKRLAAGAVAKLSEQTPDEDSQPANSRLGKIGK